MNNLRCEKCGVEMIYKIDNHIQGWYCPNCEWAVVTSYFNKIELDDTDYKMKIAPNNETSLENIKVIAKLGNCNFISAKQFLIIGGLLIEDKAIYLHDKISKLDSLKIKYVITPNYPHK